MEDPTVTKAIVTRTSRDLPLVFQHMVSSDAALIFPDHFSHSNHHQPRDRQSLCSLVHCTIRNQDPST